LSQAGHKWLAAAASVLLHLLALAVLATVGFSYEKSPAATENQRQVKVEYVKNLIQNPPLVNKPKLQSRYIGKSPLPKPLQFETPTELVKYQLKIQQDTYVNTEIRDYEDGLKQQDISFFSSKSGSRRICFLVDCSGSMQGLWGTVKAELIRSIDSLLADQYFSVVFFGDNGIVQFTDSRLVRASATNKEKAMGFVQSAKPGGQTNAFAGFNAAVKIRDAYSAGPDVIFFLTDGFELMGEDTGKFELAVLGLVQDNLPQVKINTIGFWSSSEDRKLLKSIANLTGGEFVIVTEDNFDER